MLEPDKRFEIRLPPIPEQPLRFASRSEYACGVMLEKYVPNFELANGFTFQVGVGFNKTIDFYVHGTFIEYHPIVLQREFDNRTALRKFFDALKQVKSYYKEAIIDAIKDELAEKYYRRRKFLVTMAAGKDAELIVAVNPQDFYRTVLKRFGVNIPKEREALVEFQTLCREKI
jgi:hypothetical protein